jgi:hypothetical protein
VGNRGQTGTFPLSEKIIAATQSSHDAIGNVPSVPRFPGHMLTSGKKNAVVYLGVVDLEGAWVFRGNNRQGNAAGAFFSPDAELDFHAAKDESLYGALLAGGLGLRFAVKGIGNVYRGAHEGYFARFIADGEAPRRHS